MATFLVLLVPGVRQHLINLTILPGECVAQRQMPTEGDGPEQQHWVLDTSVLITTHSNQSVSESLIRPLGDCCKFEKLILYEQIKQQNSGCNCQQTSFYSDSAVPPSSILWNEMTRVEASSWCISLRQSQLPHPTVLNIQRHNPSWITNQVLYLSPCGQLFYEDINFKWQEEGNKSLYILIRIHYPFTSLTSYLFILSFQGHTHGIWRFSGYRSNQSCSYRPKPQPQHRQI